MRCKYTSFLFIANFSCTFFCFSKLTIYNFMNKTSRKKFVNIIKRSINNTLKITTKQPLIAFILTAHAIHKIHRKHKVILP